MGKAVQPHPTAKDAGGKALLQYLSPDHLTLILVRHGQRGGPPVEGYPGKSLTKLGHVQARRLAARLAQIPIDHIYSSDMSRAYQTAQPLCALRPEVPFTLLSDLRELSIADQPNYPPDLTPEDRHILHQRRVDRVAELLRTRHHPGEVIVCMAHGGMNNMLISAFWGIPRRLLIAHHNAALTVASIGHDGTLTLRVANCTRHLLPTQLTMTSRDRSRASHQG